jgi:LAO/AO transport system kinase
MLSQRSQRQVRSEVQSLILHSVMNALQAQVSEEEWNTLVEDVTKRERDPYSVANELQQRIGLKN